MEFHEKLQELRKRKGLTQEELAEYLYVSRTAISKWEQGRGYPSLDSLREISQFFSVSIDELLSGDVLISIAEKDNKAKVKRLYDFLLGVIDLLAVALVMFPLYPETIDGFVYSVSLLSYNEIAPHILTMYWIMFLTFIVLGTAKLFVLKCRAGKGAKLISDISVGFNVIVLIFLAISREAYATVLVTMMLVAKMIIMLKDSKRNIYGEEEQA